MPDALAPPALLRAAIAASGLTTSGYARNVLIRDPRTVRRWLAGTSPIPAAVLAHLAGGAGLGPAPRIRTHTAPATGEGGS